MRIGFQATQLQLGIQVAEMDDDRLPPEVRTLIDEHIDSVAHLEALVLMKNNSQSEWTAATIAQRLYVADDDAAKILSHLCDRMLIQVKADGSYLFAPEPERLAKAALLLVDLYTTHLIPLTRLIHAKPHRIQQFANAFKFRKD